MSDIFREIDEELRRENLLKLWSRYGRYIVIVVVAILVLAGGYVAWRDHQLKQREVQSEHFSAALALTREGKTKEAATMFATIAGEGGGYGVLASFEQAALLARSGDHKGAAALYDRIAASDTPAPLFHDAAVLFAVMHEFADETPQRAIARLQPLTASGNPWRPSAVELTALAKLKAGDRNGALALYKTLADDRKAPQGLRGRAAEMVAALAPDAKP